MPLWLLTRPWTLKLIGFAAVALAITLFVLGQRRAGANAAKAAMKLETLTRVARNAQVRREVEESIAQRGGAAAGVDGGRTAGQRLHDDWGRD